MLSETRSDQLGFVELFSSALTAQLAVILTVAFSCQSQSCLGGLATLA